MADDGSETRSVGENSWAYGVERYEVITQRLPDGALRVRTRKTETVNATPPAGPDDMFSTEDDQAARLSELAPVGSWTEVVVHGGARQPHVDPAMSLKGWISMGMTRQRPWRMPARCMGASKASGTHHSHPRGGSTVVCIVPFMRSIFTCAPDWQV